VPEVFFTIPEVLREFGAGDLDLAAMSWAWECGEDGEDVSDEELAAVFLVSTSGARVPLSEVPKLFGKDVTREMCRALGFEVTPSPGAGTARGLTRKQKRRNISG
jgi:hypothetical protein